MNQDYDEWAEQLLQELYYTPEHLRALLIKEHLLKSFRRGYTVTFCEGENDENIC